MSEIYKISQQSIAKIIDSVDKIYKEVEIVTTREEYELRLKIIEQWIEIKPNEELMEALKTAQREIKELGLVEYQREI